MDIILGLIKKDNKHSTTNTEKYTVLDCQNKNTTHFIKLNDIIKETRYLKIFDADFIKNKVIVKIGESATIEREYKISHALYYQNYTIKLEKQHEYLYNKKYYIRYVCYFMCKNNLKNIVENSTICANDGTELKILVMMKYKLGSIKNYNWNQTNFNTLINLIKQIFFGLYQAYVNFGFIHNDVHFGNFLIKKTNDDYSVIIIDFENSLFDLNKTNVTTFYQMLRQIIQNINFELNINTTNIEDILNKLNTNKLIDINVLLNDIDKISFVSMIDKSKLLKYNPDIFTL